MTNEHLTGIVIKLTETVALLRRIAQASENELENHEKRIRKLEDLK